MGDSTSGRFGLGRFGAARFNKAGEDLYLTISGVDVRGAINWRKFNWTELTGSQPDTVTLPIREFFIDSFIETSDGDTIQTTDADDLVAQLLLNPAGDEVVELAIGAPDALVFSGHVQKSSRGNVSSALDSTGLRTTLTAVGIERKLRDKLVWGTFTGSASAIVLELVQLFTAGNITTGGVQGGAPVVGSMTFKQVPFPVALDRIAERVGWSWNMRVLDLNFYDSISEPKARKLDENGGFYIKTLKAGTDISQLRNRIYVEGSGGLTAEPAVAGDRAIIVADSSNFQDLLDQDIHGYIQGENLLDETDMLNVWTQTGLTSVTEVTGPAGIVEGDVAVSVLSPDNLGFIQEDVLGVATGTNTFSVMVKEGTATTSRVQIRDSTAGVNRILAEVTFAAGVPTVTMLNGTLFRPPVIAVPTAPDGWYWFILQATDFVSGNLHFMRLYGSRDLGGGSTEWWGPMGEVGAEYSLFATVQHDTVPNVGSTTTRKRRIAWLRDQRIAYRWAFTGVATFENWAPFSYELDLWATGERTNVDVNKGNDTDGNATLELIEWDGTGGAGSQRDIGVDDGSVEVTLTSDGTFALQVDVRDGPVTGAGFARIGFFETGVSLPVAGNLVAASFNLGTGASLNVTAGATASQVDQGGGLRTLRVTGQMAAFSQGQNVRCSVYPCKSNGTIGVTPNTDGDQIIAGRTGLERGSAFSGPVVETGPTPESAPSEEFSMIGGIPGTGPYAISSNHPAGSDVFPWVVRQDQESINERAIVTVGSWMHDGPVEFFKRDRRLTAVGMIASGDQDLQQYIGIDQNARVQGNYKSRDKSIRAGREVEIDIPAINIGPITVTIVKAVTTYLKRGILERAVQFEQALPRSLSLLLQSTKRFPIEEE